jgi:hypothetical protein
MINYDDDGFNEDMLVIDLERGSYSNLNNDSFYSDEQQLKMAHLKLDREDLKKLLNSCVITKKEILKIDMIGNNCSICFESLESIKKPIVKLPKCLHLFHWKYFT